MITRSAHGLLLVGTTLLVLGLGTANSLLLGLSAIPFTAVILGLAEPLPGPKGGSIRVADRARAGDVVEVTVDLDVEGSGLVAASVPLPKEFEVTEESNAVVLAVEEGTEVESFSFKVRAAKRGRYTIGPVQAAAVTRYGLRSRQADPVGDAEGVEVHPGLIPLRRLRRMRGTAVALGPEEDVARVGLKTTDFRELREYRYGDPPRAVNWKATARMGPAADKPLVNEYEVEGRKAVWFLLDAGRHMAVGTTVENGFEAAVAAVSGLSLAYLDRGYRVGLHAYNTDAGDPLYPDVGDKQFYKLQRRLASLEPGPAEEGPLEAVLASKPWIVQQSPMVVLVTRTDVATDELEDALQRLNALTADQPRPVVVIEPLGYHLVPSDEAADHAARLLDQAARSRYDRLRRHGATVLPWNPREDPLERLLFRDVVRRG